MNYRIPVPSIHYYLFLHHFTKVITYLNLSIAYYYTHYNIVVTSLLHRHCKYIASLLHILTVISALLLPIVNNAIICYYVIITYYCQVANAATAAAVQHWQLAS